MKEVVVKVDERNEQKTYIVQMPQYGNDDPLTAEMAKAARTLAGGPQSFATVSDDFTSFRVTKNATKL